MKTSATVVALAFACGGSHAPAAGSGSSKPHRRATPPAPSWDKATSGTFFDDAFRILEGPRPAFEQPDRSAAGPTQVAESAAAVAAFRWSKLISEDTLTDEIMDMRSVITRVAASPSEFKGGGYDGAREAFGSIALAFGVIAAYDKDVRWKKEAATARDLFARAGFNCRAGTDQSFAETKARMDDLEAMIRGGSPEGSPERDGDFSWSRVTGRPELMTRLETAEAVIAAGITSRNDFGRDLERVFHDAEIMAVIGEVIQQPDFEYHDDDSYRGHAAAMRNAALKIRDACGKKDYEAARAAAGDLRKSCDDCHGDYRG